MRGRCWSAFLVAIVATAYPVRSAPEGTGEENDAAYSRSLAESRYLDGDLESAVHLYLQASRLSTDVAERTGALVNAAWLEFLLGDESQATAILHAALRADPELELDERLYTDGFLGAFLRARLALVREGFQSPAAPRPTEPRTAVPGPDDPRAIYARAAARLQIDDRDGALTLFQRVAALTVGEEGDARELRRKSLVRIGWLYYQRGQWNDAAGSYDEALAIDRSDTETWKNLGLARLRARELPAAIAAFREAYARDPGDLSIAHNLARSLVLHESWDDAVSWISDAVRHHERDAELRLQLGRAHAGRGSLSHAEEAWRLAMSLDTATDWERGRGAALQLALSLFERGSYPESAEVSRIALDHGPSDAAFQNLLGLALQESGDIQGAVRSFEQACEHDSQRAEYRNNLGRALAAAGALSEAEQAFVLALSLEPDFETAQANLLQVRARLRQR